MILAPGTSGVLEIIFGTVCEPGQTILIPRPHFTIYGCLAGALDIKLNRYKLLVRMYEWERGEGEGKRREIFERELISFVAREKLGG